MSALIAMGAAVSGNAQMASADEEQNQTVIVTGLREHATVATKTDTPLIETPQPISIIPDEIYLAQGALSIADTLRYTPGVTASAYGLDSRIDSSFVRGVEPLQFRDGMREFIGSYNSITADPYNFSRVEVLRGPASVLFGQGSIGGLINLVSKMPQFETAGEVSLRYGSFDRKEALFDVTGPISADVAGRLVARVRDAKTQTDYADDDRVMIAPSLTWAPGTRTTLSLIGLYQEDDGGSTAQFLPIDAILGRNEPGSRQAITPNPNGRVPYDTFIGEPGYDRYDGRVLQLTGVFEHRLSDAVALRSRVRWLDSDVDYVTHYPDSYTNPFNPYIDANRRVLRRYNSVAYNDLNTFTTDNNVQLKFNTGPAIQHTLIGGVDYIWNKLRSRAGLDRATTIDLYDPQYGNLSRPVVTRRPDAVQKQVGFYGQDQIKFFDRVNVVLGLRHDRVRNRAGTAPAQKSNATTFRAGIIGQLAANISPFFSYTESFLPVAGVNGLTGELYRPQRGEQYEIGAKWQPDATTLVTVTGYRIRNTNRLVPNPANPLFSIQAGEATSKGFEVEAVRILPDNYDVILSYSYNDAVISQSSNTAQIGLQLDNVPKHNASAWGTKTFDLGNDVALRLGAGVRYVGANKSFGIVRTSVSPLTFGVANIIRTPSYTLADALVSFDWGRWQVAVNATNLFDKEYPAACLARGDCFLGARRNIFGTLTYRFQGR